MDANLNRAGNNCWSHATALITESRLCIESRGQFLAAKAPGQEVGGEMGKFFCCQPLMKFAVNININLFFYILSGLDSSEKCGRRTSCAAGKFPRFNGANAWLSQSFIAACRHRSHFFRRFQDVSWHATVPCAGLMAVTIAWEVPGFLVSRLFQGTACAAFSRLLSVPVSVLTPVFTCFRWGVPTGGPDFRGNMKDGTG